MYSIISAIAKNKTIGCDNKLPWKLLPEDMVWFRKHTKDKPCILGMNTFESISKYTKGKLLPVESFYVVTRKNYHPEHQNIPIIYGDLDRIVRITKSMDKEVMVLGGQSIYQQMLDKSLISKIYLTVIYNEYKGDTHFPELHDEWYPSYQQMLPLNSSKPLQEDNKIKFFILDKCGERTGVQVETICELI